MTLWEWLKENWRITKTRVKEMGINPNKDLNETTYAELCWLADEMEVTLSEFVQ